MQNSPLCEQWDEDDWVRDCEIVGHPPNKTDQTVMVKIIGLEVTLYKHQLIAGFWMIFHERGECEGGWLADDMGLGKVRTLLHTQLQKLAPGSGQAGAELRLTWPNPLDIH